MQPAKVLKDGEGETRSLAAIGVRLMIGGADTGENFSLVEHPMPPRALAAPMHRHANEDEYSYVLEGRVGAKLGDEIVHGEPGDLIFKPRGQWHTFWNAGDEPARLLEIISPAGFERYFEELSSIPPERIPAEVGPVAARYDLELDPSTIPGLVQEHGLVFPGAPPPGEAPA